MKRVLTFPAIAVIFFVAACNSGGKKEEKEAQHGYQNVKDVKQAFILKKQEVNFSLNLPAELLAYEKAEIHAKVNGYVQSLQADIGDKVYKGQVLARLDAPEVVAQYAQALAKYNETQARFNASKDRYTRIFNASQKEGVISEAEVVYVKSQMLSDSAALSSAESAAHAYRQLQEYLTIRAPFSGFVTNRFVYTGDFIGNPGKSALFVLENSSLLRLRIHVPESHVKNIPSADNLEFSVDALSNKIFSAKLKRKSGSINRETRTELWEYEYNNDELQLQPGMYASAQLRLNRPDESFVVPYPALVTSMERKFVIRVNNGVVEWVDVREGISLDNGKEVFGNLKEGDTLLARGSEELKPGTKISIHTE